jgi:hypothetical protein
MSANISQREARRLKKRVEVLERADIARNGAWTRDYPGGVHLNTITVNDTEWHIIVTARKLGHACVVVPVDGSRINVYALR